MLFKVTRHASGSPPQNAIDLLGELIAGRHDDACFKPAGSYIAVRIDSEDPVGRAPEEFTEILRLKVLEIVGEVCERTPGLKLDWYAVRPAA